MRVSSWNGSYVIHQFECFIPKKDVEENLLKLSLVTENVMDFKKSEKFQKSIMGQSTEVLNQDATMEKCKCYGALF